MSYNIKKKYKTVHRKNYKYYVSRKAKGGWAKLLLALLASDFSYFCIINPEAG